MLDSAAISAYLGGWRHPLYEAAVGLAARLAVHARGAAPTELLKVARPNEAQQYQDYRLAVWEPITAGSFDKIHGQVAKLQRAQGLTLTWPEVELSASVLPGANPVRYLTQDYPEHDHVMTWLFTFATRELLADPNAVCVVLPREGLTLPWPADSAAGYLTPVATIYPAADVFDYVAGEWAVVVLSRTVAYKNGSGGEQKDGLKLLIVDRTHFLIATQTGAKDGGGNVPFRQEAYPHQTGHLPVVRLGSTTVEAARDGRAVFRSFVSPCVAHWNEVVRRYSDHQVNMALHLHPEKVIKTTTGCQAAGCHDGRVRIADPRPSEPMDRACGTCQGTGYVHVVSPFGVHLVPPVRKGVNDTDMPAGELISYVEKKTETLQFLVDEYRRQSEDALDAIGLGFLKETPLNQSGTAKAYDRSEINVFFAAVAQHIVAQLLRPVIWYTLQQRYGFVEAAAREKWYDAVNVTIPDSFDVVGLDYYRERVKLSAANNEPALLRAAAELEYAAKEYGEQSLTYRMQRVVLALDPLPGISTADKSELVLMGAASALDARVSAQLPALVRRAVEAGAGFLALDFAAQREAVYVLARADASATALAPAAPVA